MPRPKKPPTTIPRRQLGRYLRDLRQEAGLSIQTASRLIERGAGTLQRLEKGEAGRIRQLDIQALCQIYDAQDKLPGLLELAKVAASNDGDGLWWYEYSDTIRADFELYVSLESAATKLTVYRPDIISGLFQTPSYAEALDATYYPDITEDELSQRVGVRLNRQRIITRKRTPVHVDLLLDENVLRRIVGSRAVMAAQLHHLANLPVNVTIGLLPFAVGFPLGVPTGPFTVLDFDPSTGERATVYVEGFQGSLYYDLPDSITRHRESFARLKAVALSAADSKQALRRVAREYER
ncbi:helix-turn-helix domain-containing protein [Nocardia sp. NPDC057227]|uniref:helix-turn-helix domain-containing protein n=1 Tax=Nocardia sp. NPDC057227 TaxID=3346056 RepID=UPI00363E8C89